MQKRPHLLEISKPNSHHLLSYCTPGVSACSPYPVMVTDASSMTVRKATFAKLDQSCLRFHIRQPDGSKRSFFEVQGETLADRSLQVSQFHQAITVSRSFVALGAIAFGSP